MNKITSCITSRHGEVTSKLIGVRQYLPFVVNINGGNHDGQPADAEPSAHVTFRLPLERYLLEQSPEKESKGRFERLRKKKLIYWSALLGCARGTITSILTAFYCG